MAAAKKAASYQVRCHLAFTSHKRSYTVGQTMCRTCRCIDKKSKIYIREGNIKENQNDASLHQLGKAEFSGSN